MTADLAAPLGRIHAHLAALVDLPGAPGHEGPVAEHVLRALPAGARWQRDVHGNLIVEATGGPEEAPRLLLAAHLDEVGMVVRAVEPDGFLRVAALGSMLAEHAAGRSVRVGPTTGVVGARAGHYRSAEVPATLHELFVDVGAASAGEAAALGVAIGSPVTWMEPLRRFGPEDRWWMGHALDDRLGVALLLALLEEAPTGAVWRWTAAFTVQEENGLRGASALPRAVGPDLALALDTIVCGDTPDLRASQDSPLRLGGGPVLPVASGPNGSGLVVQPAVLAYLEGVARAAGVPLQRAVLGRGDNDASAMAWSHPGARAASVAVPRRYAHTAVEVANAGDVEATYRLLAALLRTPPTGVLA